MCFSAVRRGCRSSPAGRHDPQSTVSISAILRAGDEVTGVRGTTNGNVILTGSAAAGTGTETVPFLFQGHLTSAAEGAAVSKLKPPFSGVTTAAFYGSDTPSFNPHAIPG